MSLNCNAKLVFDWWNGLAQPSLDLKNEVLKRHKKPMDLYQIQDWLHSARVNTVNLVFEVKDQDIYF